MSITAQCPPTGGRRLYCRFPARQCDPGQTYRHRPELFSRISGFHRVVQRVGRLQEEGEQIRLPRPAGMITQSFLQGIQRMLAGAT